MQLRFQNFGALVASASATVQGTTRTLIDMSVGSTLRALVEASASIALWVQWLVLQVLQTTRAATSQADDLDSWVADFGLQRLAAVAARGEATLTRYAARENAFIPVGTQLRSGDGALLFAVVGDASRPGWDEAGARYVMAEGVTSLIVPVVAVEAGAAGNVQAGAISLIAGSLAGVDLVLNEAPLADGRDAEDDDALRARFSRFLDSRARATPGAIAFAVDSVQQGLDHTLVENALPDGTPVMGAFVLTVDDGSGGPSPSLIAAVAAAVEAMRPVGAVYSVRGPAVVELNLALTIDVAPGAAGGATRAMVAAAVRAHVDGLGLGQPVVWSRLYQVAFAASPDVLRVNALTLAGGTADVPMSPGQKARAGLVLVT